MAIKADLATKERKRILKELQQEQEKLARDAAEEVRRFIEQTLKRTFAHWNASGENRFSLPTVKTVVTVSTTGAGNAKATFETTVVDAGGAPHKLWHWLSFGTPSRIQKKTTPVLKARRSIRTFPGNLDANPFPGFTGETFVIPAGTPVRGIPARGWYEAAADEIESWLNGKGGKLGSLEGWDVDNVEVNQL